MKPILKLVIYGNLLSKSNSRIFSYRNGRPLMIKSPKAISYASQALVQLNTQVNPENMLDGPVELRGTIYYSSRRSDLDISLLMDLLEKAGVYKNDRQVFKICFNKALDKINPRSEIEIVNL